MQAAVGKSGNAQDDGAVRAFGHHLLFSPFKLPRIPPSLGLQVRGLLFIHKILHDLSIP